MGKLFIPVAVLRLAVLWHRRRVACIGCILPLLWVPLGYAQPGSSQSGVSSDFSVNTDNVSAQIQSLDSLEAEQERLRKLIADKPPAYQDKVMEPVTLLLGETESDAPLAEPDGFRSWSLEGRVGFADYESDAQGRQRAGETGIRGEYRQETQNYGEFSLQADVRARNSGDADASVGSLLAAREKNAARVTVRNYGFPVTTSITADTSAGDITSELTDAFSRSYRVSLGSSQVRGVGTRLSDGKFDLRAGMGQRGELTGGPYAGFEATQGKVSWLGYSQHLENGLTAGVQMNQAKDIPALDRAASLANTGSSENVDSLAASLGYGGDLEGDGDKKARITVLTSRVSAQNQVQDSDASGVFVEGGFRSGRYRHEMGVFGSEPDLRFGDNALVSDNRGAYWRTDRSGSRLSVGGGVDVEHYNAGTEGAAASRRVGVNANARYRIDRDRSIGGSVSIGDSRSVQESGAASTDSHARSSNLNAYYQTRFGALEPTRFSAILHQNESLVTNGAAATGDELQWEQDWITGKYETMRPELATTLGLAHDRSTGETQTYPTAGVNARYWLDGDWNVAGNLRYTSRQGNLSTSQGLSGTASTEYDMGSGWRTGATASMNQARVAVSGNSLLEPQVSRSTDKSAQLYLRWEEASGSPYQLVGKRNDGFAGSGSITGAVFFDANRDGEQQADEAKVPGVELFLDGRYRTTTGKDGRFEFTQVTTGKHDLTLNLDTVPLPWGSAREHNVSVDVPLRGWAEAYIPVVKTGE